MLPRPCPGSSLSGCPVVAWPRAWLHEACGQHTLRQHSNGRYTTDNCFARVTTCHTLVGVSLVPFSHRVGPPATGPDIRNTWTNPLSLRYTITVNAPPRTLHAIPENHKQHTSLIVHNQQFFFFPRDKNKNSSLPIDGKTGNTTRIDLSTDHPPCRDPTSHISNYTYL